MLTAGVVVVALLLYAAGVRALWRHAGPGHGITRLAYGSALAGFAVIFLALLPPLADLAEQTLVAHMIQHAMLMLLAPPLFVFGRAWTAICWAWPESRADSLPRRTLHAVARGWHTITTPVVAAVLYGLAFWIWHLPALYDLALDHEWVHVGEHATFFGTAMIFWTSILVRRGVHGYGIAAATLFITALHSGGLGALLGMSTRVWYATYLDELGLQRALNDQQLGGLLMWIPFGVPYTVAGLACVAAFIRDSRRSAARVIAP